MDDFDFLHALSDRDDVKKEASVFFKKASPLQEAATGCVQQNATRIGAALAAAAVGTTAQYLANKPRGGKDSVQQSAAKAALEGSQRAKARDGESFGTDLAEATSRGVKDLSDVAAKHPGKAALMTGPLWLAAGWRAAKALKR